MPGNSFPSLNPMSGLGSGARTIGAITISSPRTKNGSAGRVYNYIKQKNGALAANNYFQSAIFGPYKILKGKLVYN